jgi:ribose transport system ATP-binding protein
MVHAMVGADISDVRRPTVVDIPTDTPPRVRIDHASSDGMFTEVSLEVRPGEVVALYGKVGSGITEVAEAVFGLHEIDAGTVEVNGGPVPTSPREAIGRGVGLLPAERKREGAFSIMSSAKNLVAPSWSGKLGRALLASRTNEGTAFARWREALHIRVSPSGAGKPIALLSGGNQQKVLLARWLEADSQTLVLLEPTRGVDVGARQEIYATIRELAHGGTAVLVATSDYEEVVQLADRAVVMAAGRTTRSLDHEAVTVAALTDASGG